MDLSYLKQSFSDRTVGYFYENEWQLGQWISLYFSPRVSLNPWLRRWSVGRWKFWNENHFHLLGIMKVWEVWRFNWLTVAYFVLLSYCLSYSYLWSFSILGSMLLNLFLCLSCSYCFGVCCSVDNGTDHMKGTNDHLALPC